jgi:hypothetical protein
MYLLVWLGLRGASRSALGALRTAAGPVIDALDETVPIEIYEGDAGELSRRLRRIVWMKEGAKRA